MNLTMKIAFFWLIQVFACFSSFSKTGLVENVGPGSPGMLMGSRCVENVGRGKRGAWWKMRDLVKNAGSGGKRGVTFFSPKHEFSSVK